MAKGFRRKRVDQVKDVIGAAIRRDGGTQGQQKKGLPEGRNQ